MSRSTTRIGPRDLSRIPGAWVSVRYLGKCWVWAAQDLKLRSVIRITPVRISCVLSVDRGIELTQRILDPANDI